MNNDFPKRKSPRLKEYDYNDTAVYFTTICVQHRKCLLSNVVGTGVLDCPYVELTRYGRIAQKYIEQLNDFYSHIFIEDYMIMPNHIHLIIFIQKNGQSRTSVPTTKANSEYSNLSQHLNAFAIKNMDIIFGKHARTSILSEIIEIMRELKHTSTKTHSNGNLMNYILKKRSKIWYRRIERKNQNFYLLPTQFSFLTHHQMITLE